MTLRLVLVSLVAALGLTIPGAPVIENWVASTQNWMNSRFADWDTRNPQTADYVIVSDFYDAERLAPRPAITSLPTATPQPSERPAPPIASSPAIATNPSLLQDTRAATVRPVSFVRKSKSFEPIQIGDKVAVGIAYELNFKNEGIGAVPPAVARTAAARPRFDPPPVVKKFSRGLEFELAQWSKTLALALPRMVFPATSPRRFEPIVVAENPRRGPAEELNQKNEGIGIKPPAVRASQPPIARASQPPITKAPQPPIARASQPPITKAPQPPIAKASQPTVACLAGFGPMETSSSLYFAGELAPPSKSVASATPKEPTKPTTLAVAVRPPQSASAPETRELPADLDIEVAGELVRCDDGFGVPAPARKPPVLIAKPRFEPLEVSGDFYVGTAHELNRRNDGTHIPAESLAHTAKADVSAPHSALQLNRAVKLTRDAVYAWVNVLTGPALVTVSQSD
jgi:hypothetical protein